MAFDLAVFGTLVSSPKELAAWKRLVVDSSRFKVIARVFPQSPNLPPSTVGQLLKELPAAGGYDLLGIERDGVMYSVRGQFAEKAFRKHARQLAALFMIAADVDIRGDVYFLGQGVREGYALQLSGGRPTLATLEDDEIDRRSRDPMLDAISDHFRVATEATPRPAVPEPAIPAWTDCPLLRFPRGNRS